MANYVAAIPAPLLANILQLGADVHKDKYSHVVHLTPDVQRFLAYCVQVTETLDPETKQYYLDKLEAAYDPRKMY